MNMKKIFTKAENLSVIFILASVFPLTGGQRGASQQLPLNNQYIVNKFSLSPAYAGAGDALEVFGSFRNDWAGISGAPETKTISANGMVCKNMGLGGTIGTYQAGIFKNNSASLSYAYHLQLGGSQWLSFGLGLGLIENHIVLADGSSQSDPIAMNNASMNSTSLDAAFGILYRCKKFHFGIDVPRLLSSKIKNADGKEVYAFAMHDGFHISYSYSCRKDWQIDPFARFMMAQNAPSTYEVAVPIKYKQKFWIAPAYKKKSMAVSFGCVPYDNFIVNYTYEFASAGIMGQSSGTHEISIGYRLMKQKKDQPAPDSKKPYYEWLNK